MLMQHVSFSNNFTKGQSILQFPAGRVDAADVRDNNAKVTKVQIMVLGDSTVRVITIKICREGECMT
jgi:hypothetical protein